MAEIVKLGPGRPEHVKVVDPLNKTIHMAIRKEKRRKAEERVRIEVEQRQKEEARVMSGRFGSIKGLDKLKVG